MKPVEDLHARLFHHVSTSHFLVHISPIFFPKIPVFCAFSPSRRGGSNGPQAGTQGQERAGKGTKRGNLPPSFDTPGAVGRITCVIGGDGDAWERRGVQRASEGDVLVEDVGDEASVVSAVLGLDLDPAQRRVVQVDVSEGLSSHFFESKEDAKGAAALTTSKIPASPTAPAGRRLRRTPAAQSNPLPKLSAQTRVRRGR